MGPSTFPSTVGRTLHDALFMLGEWAECLDGCDGDVDEMPRIQKHVSTDIKI
jgi:hypothetical protein